MVLKRIVSLLTALAIVAPVNAGFMYDLSLMSGDVVGSGQIAFDDTTITDFMFTVAPATGGPAPLPKIFILGDIHTAEWDIVGGALDYC